MQDKKSDPPNLGTDDLPHPETDETDTTAPSLDKHSPESLFASPPPGDTHLKNKSYAELNLSPTGLIEIGVAETRMRSDGVFDQPFLQTCDAKLEAKLERIIYFLYAFGFCWFEDRDLRMQHIAYMVEPKNRERLEQLMEATGDQDLSGKEEERLRCEMFNKSIWRFLEVHVSHAWYVLALPFLYRRIGFLKDMLQAVFFLGFQTCVNCYLHAPCFFVGYQMQRDLPGSGFGKVDISQFARRSMESLDLWRYVVLDAGGSSAEQLRKLLGLTKKEDLLSVDSRQGPYITGLNLMRNLQEYGPGLVSCFTVHENFAKCANIEHATPGFHQFDGDKDCEGVFVELLEPTTNEEERLHKIWSQQLGNIPLSPHQKTILFGDGTPGADDGLGHEEPNFSVAPATQPQLAPAPPPPAPGPPPQPFTETAETPNQNYHAMVLLFGYVDVWGKEWFLLQNWWKNMPLVLVSASYLTACESTFEFLPKPMNAAPGFRLCQGPVTQCAFQDHANRQETPLPGPPTRESGH